MSATPLKWVAIDRPRPMRHAMEIRHESFLDARFLALLRARGVALVIAETARKWPMPHDLTADFVYLRLHGDRTLYQSGYGPAALARWADRIAEWQRGGEPAELARGGVRISGPAPVLRSGRDVYCYFDNTDVKLRAPADARSLMRLLARDPARTGRRASSRASCPPRSTPAPSPR